MRDRGVCQWRQKGGAPADQEGGFLCLYFFFKDPAPPEIYPLSPPDPLPFSWARRPPRPRPRAGPAASTRAPWRDRKSTRLNSSHSQISYAVFCLKKKNVATSMNRLGVRNRRRTAKPVCQFPSTRPRNNTVTN